MGRYVTRYILSASLILMFALPARAAKEASSPAMVRLPGHVLPALAKATLIPSNPGSANQPITLTIVLRRDDQAGFERYLHDLYDPRSKVYRHFLTQRQIAGHFGPSQSDYASVLAYLHSHGFKLVESSTNRLTLTVRGTRTQAEHAFQLAIDDYKAGNRHFFASSADPALPSPIAAKIQAIVGLSNLARPRNTVGSVRPAFSSVVQFINDRSNGATPGTPGYGTTVGSATSGNATSPSGGTTPQVKLQSDLVNAGANLGDPPATWLNINGAGQTVGLVEFDNFNTSDIANYIALFGLPTSQLNQVSEVNVNGGVAIGPSEPEVLIDIVAVMGIAPGANIVVYDAPFANPVSSFQAVFNSMLDNGVSIISNSWYYCESESDSADAQSIDSIMASAAAAGVSVFNATGDSGATCGGTGVSLPASSPHGTAVGGSSAIALPGFVYGTETWWNGVDEAPPTGQGGFGTSQFFSEPSYQSGFAGRSVPDVVVNADPDNGIIICQADAGGCPTGEFYGGTSLAAPEWAGFAALLNQGQGSNLGFLNPLIYPFANSNSFHSAASQQ
jgi:subtilase family serine protease